MPRPVWLLRQLVPLWLGASWLAGPAAAQLEGRDHRPLHFDEARIVSSLPVDAFAPHLDEDGDAWESWDYLFRFSDGHLLIAQFQVNNAGPGSHRALAVGIVVTPDGTVSLMKNSRGGGEWTHAAGPRGVHLRIGPHQVDIFPPRHRVHMQGRQGTFTVEAEAITPMVRPGKMRYADQEYQELTVLAPRFRARAKLRLTDGVELSLTDGTGIATYTRSNLADYKQAVSILRFHTFDGPTQVSVLEFTTPKRYRYQRIALLLVVRGQEIVQQSYVFDRRYTALHPDPHKDDYLVPEGFQLSGNASEDGLAGKVELQLLQRFDIVDWINSGIARFFLKRVSHPIEYLFRAPYELELRRNGAMERLSGQGFAVLYLLNKPPEKGW